MTPYFRQEPADRRLLHGIQAKLILLLCILLIPTLLLEIYVYHYRFANRRSEELRANLEMARAVAKNFDVYIQDILHQELVLGLALSSPYFPSEERQRLIDQCMAQQPTLLDIFWMDRDGTTISAYLRNAVGMTASDRDYFKRLVAGEAWAVSDLLVSRATGELSFTISRAIRDDSGELLGAIGAIILPDRMDHELGIKREGNAGFTLVDRSGMLVYRFPHIQLTWEDRQWAAKVAPYREALKGREAAEFVIAASDNKGRFVGATPIPSIGWAAAAGRDADASLASIRAVLLSQTIVLIVTTLAAFGAVITFSRKMSMSLERLRRHALALVSEDSQASSMLSDTATLDELANCICRMIDDSQQQALKFSLSDHLSQGLNLIHNLVLSATDFDAMMHGIMADAADILGTETAIISMRTGDHWTVKYVYGLPADIIGTETTDEQKPHALLAVTTREVLVINDALNDERVNREQMRAWDVYSTLVVPLLGDGETFGVMSFSQHRPGKHFNQLQVDFASKLAETFSLSLRYRHLMEELQLQLNDARMELLAVPVKLMEAEEAGKRNLVSQFDAGIEKTLTALKSSREHVLRTLRENEEGTLRAEIESLTSAIEASIQKIQTMRMEIRPREPENFEFTESLRSCREELLKLYPGQRIEIETGLGEDEVPVHLKRPILRVTRDVLSNISKHGNAGWAYVSLSKNGAGIELLVSCDGAGTEVGLIGQGAAAGKVDQTSIREIAELAGVTLTIESTPGEGITIQANWPIS